MEVVLLELISSVTIEAILLSVIGGAIMGTLAALLPMMFLGSPVRHSRYLATRWLFFVLWLVGTTTILPQGIARFIDSGTYVAFGFLSATWFIYAFTTVMTFNLLRRFRRDKTADDAKRQT